MQHHSFMPYAPARVLTGHLKLGGENVQGRKIAVNSLYIEDDGEPVIPVMGECHFARYAREGWREALCKMKAGGVTIVSTYIFWIYHEEIEGRYDFSGDRDVRAFVTCCAQEGLDVALRIGPWAHGECRNGGFPDWLVQKPYAKRTNDPDYLQKVRAWYARIAQEVSGLTFDQGGPIIAIQLENELVDQPEHLLELKRLAAACGLRAPLYTVTGWNSASGARIPTDEVLPVFGGYPEAPWENHTHVLAPSSHFFFNRMRNDSAIGADLLEAADVGGERMPYERYPFATCELGGGVQVTHHRRPLIAPMDIYALSLIKLGSGNNLIGYYMYHGGTNKIGQHSTLQESRATGYPNDYPILSYDFQAPLSQYGEVRGHYRLLNLLHLFARDFGALLAPMQAVDASWTVRREDTQALRAGLRTDGRGGFVFINHHQRLTRLVDVHGVVIDTGSIVFPPIDVCGEIAFFLPYNMPLEKALLAYATAQPVCRAGCTVFFAAIEGIAPRYHFASGRTYTPKPGLDSAFEEEGVRIVTLSFEQACFLRRLDGTVYIGDGCDVYACEKEIRAVQPGNYGYWCFDGKRFAYMRVEKPFCPARLTLTPLEYAPFEPPFGEALAIGGKRAVRWYSAAVQGEGGLVEIPYEGDVAHLYADGALVADDFFYGRPWRVPAALLNGKTCYLAVSERRDDFYCEV